eukprot:GEMP01000640.1.p1 GENE.GEMP01000640.1~~GEMP01000640.1.p1  ORF type:complete len:1067 (+),score=179.97 GEMP01000640.1:1782-4982(+)
MLVHIVFNCTSCSIYGKVAHELQHRSIQVIFHVVKTYTSRAGHEYTYIYRVYIYILYIAYEKKSSLKQQNMASSPVDATDRQPRLKLLLGICTMDRKALSRPMKALLKELCVPDEIPVEFEIVHFGDDVILEKPIEEWPICHCLVCFHTHGFPLEKALAYVQLRQPVVLNDVPIQKDLLDRRFVYQTLMDHQIPVPDHVIVDYAENPEVIEDDEYIEVNGKRIMKPLVEKPASAEDHNIHIYYPSSEPYNGGVTRLFRKREIDGVARSSMFVPGVAKLRRDGCYIYELFVPTGGVDIKAYAVGPEYVHVEARKAPGVDGFVDRDANGFEPRYPIILSSKEKGTIADTVKAFKQNVCGIDIMRSHKKSYVVDVNGWSFVKNATKYYQDAGWILRRFFYNKIQKRHQVERLPAPPLRSESFYLPIDASRLSCGSPGGVTDLKAVLSFFRHGDITPRDKLKTLVTAPRLVALLGGENSVTFRNRGSLRKMLTEFEELLGNAENGVENIGIRKSHLVTIVTVLRESADVVSHCKVQLRRSESEEVPDTILSPPPPQGGDAAPSRHTLGTTRSSPRFKSMSRQSSLWTNVQEIESFASGLCATGRPSENDDRTHIGPGPAVWVIIKWGGNLTEEGHEQAVTVGKDFRSSMYPDVDGLLRLHATYRHDLKIYTTEEAREIATAAAFAKGLLCLRGSLAQIATMCIETKRGLLEGTDDRLRLKLRAIRKKLEDYINSDSADATFFALPKTQESCQRLIDTFGSLYDAIHEYIPDICLKVADRAPKDSDLAKRWRGFVDALNGRTSKVVSFYWSVQHDLIHHKDVLEACLGPDEYTHFVSVLDDVARCLVPQEFGIEEADKILVARTVAGKILQRLMTDFSQVTMGRSSSNSDFHPEGSLDDSLEGNQLHGFKKQFDSQPPLLVSKSDLESLSALPDSDDQTRYELDVNRMEEELPHFRQVRTRLYFTRKSQLLGLLHLLLLLPLPEESKSILQMKAYSLAYLASITFLIVRKTRASSSKLVVQIVFSQNGSEQEMLGELPISALYDWLATTPLVPLVSSKSHDDSRPSAWRDV